jgi:hypothetical protein
VNINRIPEGGLLDAANLINTVFYLDQRNTLREFLRKLKQAGKVLGKLSEDQRVDLMGWLRDVLVKKIRGAHPEAEGLETMIDAFGKGESEPMVYAIERMIDEIEEKAREAGEKTGREAGEKTGREAGEKTGREAGEKTGREAGEKTGREAREEEIVKNLLALGVSVETIQEASGMSLDKIERLRGGGSLIKH